MPNSAANNDVIIIDGIEMVRLLGAQDRLLTNLEHQYPLVDVHVRGNEIRLLPKVPSEDAQAQVIGAKALMEELLAMVRNGQDLAPADVAESKHIQDAHPHTSPSAVLGEDILSTRGKTLRPKTVGQQEYVRAIDDHTITFGIGPAGTGNTYLAFAIAK